ncbi:hypothetical protein [Burkholderia metallica]|uniref:hypothetical protein n=1 Tax=Burkholderia metallica TaxID=488729 RepID=UPI001CF5A2F8|nr:hypothetical protein [Burkholderia metallica]MCA7996759.1 hypothetical protein [Burkholderia metallica]
MSFSDTALRRSEVGTRMMAAAIMRERHPPQVAPFVSDAGIGFRYHVAEITAVHETFSHAPLRKDFVGTQQRIASGKRIARSRLTRWR